MYLGRLRIKALIIISGVSFHKPTGEFESAIAESVRGRNSLEVVDPVIVDEKLDRLSLYRAKQARPVPYYRISQFEDGVDDVTCIAGASLDHSKLTLLCLRQ